MKTNKKLLLALGTIATAAAPVAMIACGSMKTTDSKDKPTGTTPNKAAPKADTPKVDTPKVDTPKVDTPKVDTPKVDTPKVDTPKVDTKKDETKGWFANGKVKDMGDKKIYFLKTEDGQNIFTTDEAEAKKNPTNLDVVITPKAGDKITVGQDTYTYYAETKYAGASGTTKKGYHVWHEGESTDLTHDAVGALMDPTAIAEMKQAGYGTDQNQQQSTMLSLLYTDNDKVNHYAPARLAPTLYQTDTNKFTKPQDTRDLAHVDNHAESGMKTVTFGDEIDQKETVIYSGQWLTVIPLDKNGVVDVANKREIQPTFGVGGSQDNINSIDFYKSGDKTFMLAVTAHSGLCYSEVDENGDFEDTFKQLTDLTSDIADGLVQVSQGQIDHQDAIDGSSNNNASLMPNFTRISTSNGVTSLELGRSMKAPLNTQRPGTYFGKVDLTISPKGELTSGGQKEFSPVSGLAGSVTSQDPLTGMTNPRIVSALSDIEDHQMFTQIMGGANVVAQSQSANAVDVLLVGDWVNDNFVSSTMFYVQTDQGQLIPLSMFGQSTQQLTGPWTQFMDQAFRMRPSKFAVNIADTSATPKSDAFSSLSLYPDCNSGIDTTTDFVFSTYKTKPSTGDVIKYSTSTDDELIYVAEDTNYDAGGTNPEGWYLDDPSAAAATPTDALSSIYHKDGSATELTTTMADAQLIESKIKPKAGDELDDGTVKYVLK